MFDKCEVLYTIWVKTSNPPNKTISLHDFWNKLLLSICCRMTNYKGKQRAYMIIICDKAIEQIFRSGQTDIKVYHRLLTFIYLHEDSSYRYKTCWNMSIYRANIDTSGQLMTD